MPLYSRGVSALACMVMLCGAAFGMEQLTLKDGRTIEGRVVGENETTVIIRTDSGIQSIEKVRISTRREKQESTVIAAPQLTSPGVHDEELAAILKSSTSFDYDLQQKLRKRLRELPPAQRLDVLITMYLERKEGSIRRFAVESMSLCKEDKRLAHVCMAAAEDKDPRVYGYAMRLLAELAAEEEAGSEVYKQADALVRRALRSKDDTVLEYAVGAVSALWKEKAIPELVIIARRGDRLAFAASMSIAGFRNEKGLEELKSLYENQPLLRIYVGRAVSQQMGDGAETFFRLVKVNDIMKGFAWRMKLPVDIKLVDMPLSEAFLLLGAKGKVEVVFDASLDGYVLEWDVTMNIKNASLKDAFQQLAASGGVGFRVERERVRVMAGVEKPVVWDAGTKSDKLSQPATLEFRDTPATEAISLIQKMAKVTIVIKPSAQTRMAYKTLFFKVDNVSLRNILQRIAQETGTRIIEKGAYVEFR